MIANRVQSKQGPAISQKGQAIAHKKNFARSEGATLFKDHGKGEIMMLLIVGEGNGG